MKKLLPFILFFIYSVTIHSQTFQPLNIDGFNADVIANGTGTAQSTTNNDIDGLSYAFKSVDWKLNATSPAQDFGFPVGGLITSAVNNNINFQLRDYSGNNVIRLNTANTPITSNVNGLVLAKKLIILATSGSGNTLMGGTINFTDGSSQNFTNVIVQDWYINAQSPIAFQNFGRVNRVDNSFENGFFPALSQLSINIDTANQSKLISSIVFKKESSTGILNIFAVTAEIVTVTPRPNITVTNFCTNSTLADIEATFTPVGIVKWYDAATSGTELPSTTPLVNGSSYYASQTIGNSESERVAVRVTLSALANAPAVNAQVFCNSATVNDLVATGTNLKWYDVATGGTALLSSTNLSTGTYYVSQIVNGCESERAAVQVTVNSAPSAPTLSTQEFCYGATVNDLIINNPNTNWYFSNSGGTALAATEVLQTGYYYATQSNGSCESSRNQVFVYINYNIFSLFNEPVAVTGFNHDIVAQTLNGNNTASRPFNYFGQYLVSSAVPGATNFLPNNNEIISEHSGIKYKLERYNANNAFSLFYNESAIINFPTNVSNSNVIYLLASSSQVDTQFSRLDVTINFTDGTTQFFPNRLIYDWYTVGVPHAIKGIGRLFSGSYVENNSENPKLFDIVLPLDQANRTKTIQSISLQSRSDDRESINVMAVSRAYNEANMSATVCPSTKISELTQFPNSLLWYESATSTTPLNRNSMLTNNLYYVSMKVGNCETDRVAVSINHITIAPPTANSQLFCTSAVVRDLVAIGTNLKWYDVATGGTELLNTTNLSTGTYYVSQTIDSCESPRTMVEVTITNMIVNIETQTNVSCFGGNDGSATVSVSGGSGAYTYSWNTVPAQTTATASNLEAGTYTVTITDANGCEKTVNVTITEPTSELVASIETQTNVSCFGGNDGSATVSVSGGSGAYTYSWNTVPAQTTATASNLEAGTYTVTITDANGCEKTVDVTITEPTLLVASIERQTDVSCFGRNDGSATVSVSGGSGAYTYSWNTVPAQTTATASNLEAGTYTVTITDANGCEKTVDVTITEPTSLVASIERQTNVSCFGRNDGSATLSVSGGSGAYTYSWNTVPAQTTATASNLEAGTYTVTITDANGCEKTVDVTITEPSSLVASIERQTNVSCFGGNDGSATVSVSGGSGAYIYSWNTVPAQTTATASNLEAGTYTVTITDANGCEKTVDVTITEPSSLVASVERQTNVSCFGGNDGSATVSVSGGSGAYTYSWNTVPAQTTATASNLEAGTYTVTITDANGCEKTVDVTITEPSSLVASIERQTNVSCFGRNDGSATVSVSGGSGAYTYSWNTVPAQTTATASNLEAGTYTVTITDANGCEKTVDVTITEPTLLVASITTQDATCFDFSTGSATVTVNNGTAPYTYLWNDALNQTTATASNLSAGTYTVTITDANRCSITETVIINQAIQVNVTASTLDQTICSGASTSILLSSTTVGTTYNWTVVTNGVSGAIAGSGNNITQLLTATTSNIGTAVYTIVPISPNGCIGNSIEVTIKVNPNPVVVATPNTQTICNGNSSLINLWSATPGTTYSWTVIQDGVSGATSGNGNIITNELFLTNNTAGQVVYRITPTANGCVGESIDVTIHVNPFVTPTFAQVAPICAGNNLDVLPTISLNGIEGTWSPALNNTQTTTYIFTPNVQNSGLLCHNTTTMTIEVYPIPVASITANATTLCSGSSLQLNFTSNVAGTTFNYQVVSTNVIGATNGTGNALSHVLTNNSTSIGEVVYAVTPIANGCEGQTVYYNVNVTPLPNLIMNISQNEICSGENVSASFSSNISGTTFNWQVQANNVVGAVSGNGNNLIQNLTTSSLNGEIVKYVVTPFYNGCEGTSQEFEVFIKPRPMVYAPQNLAVCSGENVLINLTASHPNVTYSYRIAQNNVIGAEAGTDAIIDQTLETISEAVGYVTYYITPSLNGCVGDTVEVKVQVNPLTKINLIDGYICYDSNTGNPISTFQIPTGLSSSSYSFVWYKNNQIIDGENTNTLSATTSGIYHVEVTNLATGCVSLSDFAVISENYNAQSINAYVNNSFTHGSIVVDVVGPGVYQYQLNGGGYQSNPVFSHLLPGIYTVEVQDTIGCTYQMYQLEILSIQNFFTPNGDGIYDTWNVWSLANQTDAEIHIFDRYGAFIKQIKPSGEGWDGTRNGVPLPATDYWFVLRYRDGVDNSLKEYKSHFSLKR